MMMTERLQESRNKSMRVKFLVARIMFVGMAERNGPINLFPGPLKGGKEKLEYDRDGVRRLGPINPDL
ncbi:hypothetical protein KM043_017610 [Ampulex compressa]|nr:hypothetical protein KM043_017610 [Ampulex compressa]